MPIDASRIELQINNLKNLLPENTIKGIDATKVSNIVKFINNNEFHDTVWQRAYISEAILRERPIKSSDQQMDFVHYAAAYQNASSHPYRCPKHKMNHCLISKYCQQDRTLHGNTCMMHIFEKELLNLKNKNYWDIRKNSIPNTNVIGEAASYFYKITTGIHEKSHPIKNPFLKPRKA
ncbi:hypothetical protein [Magnetospirillum sp. 64-120]|uniref:hypothetical protein n=1 Tax=Magnetospirillum sp. 64-120 TaxID=1895778 RepID=UPI0025B85930|nr:hypothetical protein [Magnetospirillum sp. 64-120]